MANAWGFDFYPPGDKIANNDFLELHKPVHLGDAAKTKTITIDDIQFTLLDYAVKNHRQYVFVQSDDVTKKKRKFWIYRSHSEFGIWRLVLYHGMLLVKGINYQSTFIHLRLQSFLNDQLKYMEPKPTKDSTDENCMGGRYYPKTENGCCWEEIDETVNDRKRQLTTQPFIHVNNPECQKNDSSTPEKFDELSRALFQTYRIVCYRELHHYHFQLDVVEFYGRFYCIEMQTRSEDAADFIPKLSVFCLMGKLYETDKTYTKTKNTIRRFCQKDMHIMPVYITDENTSITPLGLYPRYIQANNFICKLFEYLSQCTELEEQNNNCFNGYAYIGDRYDNLYPFTFLRYTLLQDDRMFHGGKRLKRKNQVRKARKKSLGKRKRSGVKRMSHKMRSSK